MHVVITGATGFVGRALVEALLADGHTVTVVSRHADRATQAFSGRVAAVSWDDEDRLVQAVGTADGVVNLAGENLSAGRWTAQRKQAIMESRTGATGRIVRAIAAAERKPAVLVSASAVGYYGPQTDRICTESDPPADDFLAQVCKAWEDEAAAVKDHGVRLAIVRLGVVLGRGGGALPRMALPFRLFAGGPVGHGRQWVPWVHRDDVIGIIMYALQQADIEGPLNAVAPEAQTNRTFSRALGRALRRPSWLPVPAAVLKLAFGEMSGLLLTGQRVAPEATLASGYTFRFPNLDPALADIYG